ncbi:MAG TPA: 50S ribosomal protein L3 [Elusimicrobiales bacterium]|nr:50S ribosomal protein L3 [Elusimicrobiales bacterium]
MTEENKNADKTQGAPQAQPEEMPSALKFIIGRKVGMTQMFDEHGELYGVSVVEAGPCRVVRTRTSERDGYTAVCLGFGHKKDSHTDNAARGIFSKLGMNPIRHMKEFRVDKIDGVKEGQTATVAARFSAGDYVDVQGVSKGKGFAGGMKRHNFRGGPASHGASDRERAPGGLASRRSLGRVLPGQRMAGHTGTDTVSMMKIKVMKVIPERNLLLLNGSVPGPNGSTVYVVRTVKSVPQPRVVTGKKAKAAAKAAPKKAAPAAKK